MSVCELSHVGISASHFERSCHFYREFLGLAECLRLYHLEDGSLMLVCFKINDTQWLEIFTGPVLDPSRLHQLAFRVLDAEAVRQRLAAQGYAVPPLAPKGQMKNLNFTTVGPDRQTIEFVEHLPDGFTELNRGHFLPASQVLERLTEVALPISDPSGADAFFVSLLGLASRPGRQQVRRVAPNGDSLRYRSDRAVPMIVFTVRSLAEAYRDLQERGRLLGYIPPDWIGADNDAAGRLCLRDPDGLEIELRPDLTVVE